MKSELGTVDPGAIKKARSALDGAFMDCQKRALDRVEVLSGSAKFFLRIGEDGSAKYTYLEESDLGDRDDREVPARRGPGRAVAQARRRRGRGPLRRWSCPLQATRPPNDWSSEKVAAALAKHGEALDAARRARAAPSTRRCTSARAAR